VRTVDARTSDAVAIALRCKAPILIEEQLLNRVCIRDEFNGAISIPISIADTKTLQAVMRQAVEEENYELASKLKEELDQRKRDTKEDNNDEQKNVD
ncbi:MAG: bifunctional nuclease family protein, partial [Bacteroidaceae bacterium]|nr:bifunctional nuclease family protein [Bacteroidaceae bacterium]